MFEEETDYICNLTTQGANLLDKGKPSIDYLITLKNIHIHKSKTTIHLFIQYAFLNSFYFMESDINLQCVSLDNRILEFSVAEPSVHVIPSHSLLRKTEKRDCF